MRAMVRFRSVPVAFSWHDESQAGQLDDFRIFQLRRAFSLEFVAASQRDHLELALNYMDLAFAAGRAAAHGQNTPGEWQPDSPVMEERAAERPAITEPCPEPPEEDA